MNSIWFSQTIRVYFFKPRNTTKSTFFSHSMNWTKGVLLTEQVFDYYWNVTGLATSNDINLDNIAWPLRPRGRSRPPIYLENDNDSTIILFILSRQCARLVFSGPFFLTSVALRLLSNKLLVYTVCLKNKHSLLFSVPFTLYVNWLKKLYFCHQV